MFFHKTRVLYSAMDNSGDETEEDDNEWGRNVVPSAPLERTDVFGNT